MAALPLRRPLARRRSVTLRELAASTFVMFRRRNAPGMYGIIMGVWRAAGLKPKVLEDTMRIQTILSLVAVGRGVSLVPTSAMGLGRQGVVFRPVRPALPKVGWEWLQPSQHVIHREYPPRHRRGRVPDTRAQISPTTSGG